MYKTDLVRAVAQRTGLSQRLVNEVVIAVTNVMSRTLVQGDKVTLTGFGTFYTRTTGSRKIREIRTGRLMTYPPICQAAFRVGEPFKTAVRTIAPKKASKK